MGREHAEASQRLLPFYLRKNIYMKKVFLICCALFTCLLTYSHAENILETEGQETSVPDVETMSFLSGIDILDSNMWDIEPKGIYAITLKLGENIYSMTQLSQVDGVQELQELQEFRQYFQPL